jgi:hypothetical protein
MPLSFAAFAQLVNDVMREMKDFALSDLQHLEALTSGQNMTDLITAIDDPDKFRQLLCEKRDLLRTKQSEYKERQLGIPKRHANIRLPL